MSGDYFDALESELREAVPRAARNRGGLGRRRWLPSRTVVAATLSVATTVAVAAVAIVLLGHHRASAPRASVPQERRRQPGVQVSGGSLGSIPTLAQLRDNFAVLRRPQTAADRTGERLCGCGAVDRFLTRLARTLPGGDRVYFIVPQSLPDTPPRSVPRSTMQVFVEQPNGNSDGYAFGPNVGYGTHPLAVSGARDRRPATRLWVGIVPDGVASARWTACRRAKESGCESRHTYTVPVIDNVAALTIPKSGQCIGCRQVQSIQWLSRDGSIVARFDRGYNLAAPPFVAGGRGSRTLPLLTPTGIGSARIGQPVAALLATLTARLGKPADAPVQASGCGIDAEYAWASPATASPLTIYVAHGRVVGYRYGSPWPNLAIAPGPGATLTTRRGLTLGTTIGVARRRYRGALHTQAHGSLNWRLKIAAGTISGQVIPIRYPLRQVTADNPIANIAVGSTGCPTEAP